MKTIVCIIFMCSLHLATRLAAQDTEHDLGQFYSEFQEYANERPMVLSYTSKDWPELEQWWIQGRAKMLELLAYSPKPLMKINCEQDEL
jgi:hypothetical protein